MDILVVPGSDIGYLFDYCTHIYDVCLHLSAGVLLTGFFIFI